MPNSTEACETCLYWVVLSETDGECRRYAPRPDFSQGQRSKQWPVTRSEAWCGEFKRREYRLKGG